MNTKAELFKAYLEENNINCFEIQEVNDERSTIVFRSTISAEGQQLPTLVILDNTFISTVRVFVAVNVLREDNKETLLQLINDLNSKQKILKYYLTEEGTLVLDYALTCKANELDVQLLMFILMEIIVKNLESEYKSIMKQIWA